MNKFVGFCKSHKKGLVIGGTVAIAVLAPLAVVTALVVNRAKTTEMSDTVAEETEMPAVEECPEVND